MAKLESEGIELEIKNIIQYDSDGIENMYEAFDLSLIVYTKNDDGVRYIHKVIVDDSFELCGNIEYLINSLNSVLNGSERQVEIEFTEPNFEFEIECIFDVEKDDVTKYLFPEMMKNSLYQIIIWLNSGNWNGTYSGNAIGAKFCLYRNELLQFAHDLQTDYDNRQIQEY